MKAYLHKSGKLKITFHVLLIVLLLFLLMNVNLQAGITGKIVGKVTDKETGDELIMANVMVKGTNYGAATDTKGDYVIINVPPGTYQLMVSYIGYATVTVEKVLVSADRTTRQNIALTPEAFQGEEVIIEAERPAIEMDRTHSSSIVRAETVDMLPVTEVREVIELQSGIVSTGGELHFRGGRGREVAYLIDGIPVSNSYSQGGGNNVAIENSMIQELEVISGTFNAEYGSAQSGVVNIITKRPSEKFRGSLKTYAGEWMSSRNDIYIGVNKVNPLAEKDIQFSLSGPIVSNKLGIFITGRLNDWENLSWYERRYNPIDGWKISAYQRWFQEHFQEEAQQSIGIYIPDSLKTGDGAMGPLSAGYSSSLSAKLSYFPTPTLSFNYHVFGSYSKSQGAGSSRRYQPDETSTSKGWAHSHFFSIRHFPLENFFYNLTFSYQLNDGEGYYRKDNKVAMYPGDDGIQPFSSSANGFSLGATPGFFTDKDGKNYRELYLLSGDFNWQVDKYNFLKAGFIVKQHKVNTYSWGFRSTTVWDNKSWPNIDQINGADHEFNEYWDLLSDYWRNWEDIYDTTRYEAYADSEYTLWRDYDIEPLEAAFYVQDKLELGEIIINSGLRLDMFMPNEKYPAELRTEAHNIGAAQNLKSAPIKFQLSPRIGISFPISSSGAFHAAYGHFFQMPSFQYMYNNPLYTMNKFQLEGRTLGNAKLEPEKTIQYEIGLQQEITSTIVADITAYYKDFRNLLGVEYATTIDAVGFSRYINRDYGNSKGITVGISKRGGDFITGGVNYTFAYAKGSSSDPNALYLIQTATQYGGEPVQFVERKILPLNWDQRHTLNIFLNFRQANNWSVGLVSWFNSGLPYSPSFAERYDIATREYRNMAQKPLRWNVDLKAKKNLKNLLGMNAALYLKVDNLFDHLNQVGVYSSTGTAKYNARLPENEELLLRQLGQEGHFILDEIDINPGYYSSPRKVQIGLEMNF
jgi:outer membrane receptor protein involved in Fe transport